MAAAVPVSVQRLVEEIVRIVATSTNNANLKQKLNTNTNLVPAIVAIITGAVQVAPETKKKVVANVPQEALADAILIIIRNSLGAKRNVKTVLPANARENVKTALNTNTSPKSNIVKLILDIIGDSTKGALTKPTANKTVKLAGPPPVNSNFILKIVLEALKRNETPEKARQLEEELRKPPRTPTNNTSNLIYKLIMSLFKNKVGPQGKMANGYNLSGDPNFIESKKKNANGKPTFNIEIPGYIFTTGNSGTGYYKNKGKPPGPVFGPAPPPPPPPPPTPANYSKLNLRGLFNARRKNPANVNKINGLIRSKLETLMRNLRYASGATLLRRAAEILKILPRNYPGRSDIVNIVIDEVRRISRKSNLDSARGNLRGVENRNVRDELNRKARNLRKKRTEGESPFNENNRRRRNNLARRRRSIGTRRPGETNEEYSRRKAEYERNKANANRLELAARRTARLRMQASRPAALPSRLPPGGGPLGPGGGPLGPGGGPLGPGGGPLGPGGGPLGPGGGPLGPGGFSPGPPPPPLPPSQQQAITNVGGVNRAVNVIATVPGGAPEVAKAAEALNETGGNVAVAVNVKGVSPAAVKAVQSLGGVKNAVNVLEGLNTMAQTPETRRRKAATRRRRAKKTPIRLTELNRVIASVKKQKLISLMAHNITRTNNIHPNDEKLKKYYKKVMKSYLLKKPFATIVKKAARKNM